MLIIYINYTTICKQLRVVPTKKPRSSRDQINAELLARPIIIAAPSKTETRVEIGGRWAGVSGAGRLVR